MGRGGGCQGGGVKDKKRGRISYPGNSSKGRGSQGSDAEAPWPHAMQQKNRAVLLHHFLTQAPPGHFVLPCPGESKSVPWAFTAHSPVPGAV